MLANDAKLTVTELVEAFAAGKLSIDDVVADLALRTWRVKPEAASETEAHRITDNWLDEGSVVELIEAAVAAGIESADRDRMVAAYRTAPDKLKLTVEQLESGDDPAQNLCAARRR